MTDLLRPIKDQIHKLWDALSSKPTIRLGTVAQASPLLVFLDGDLDEDDDPVSTPALSLVTHTVGDRVICAEQHRRVLVIQSD